MSAGEPRDDADWVAALRGREVPGGDPRTLDEACRVRAAIRKEDGAQTTEPVSRLPELMARLDRENLLAAAPPRRARSLYAVAASFALTAIILTIVAIHREDDTPEALRTRSVPAPVLRVTASDPAARAGELAASLKAAGADAAASQAGERYRVTATVPEASAPAVGKVLAEAGLPYAGEKVIRFDVERARSSARP